jgi:hypothetical protein
MHCYLLFHNKRHPKEMGNPEIQAFLTQLAVLDRMGGVTKLMSNGVRYPRMGGTR